MNWMLRNMDELRKMVYGDQTVIVKSVKYLMVEKQLSGQSRKVEVDRTAL
jgi:hypothetical protein